MKSIVQKLKENFKETSLPILVFAAALIAFFYINYVEPSESVEKKIAIKASHDPQIVVSNNLPVPKVKLNLETDKKSGVNVKVDFENFALTPKEVNTMDRPNEGHMHLYVNGYKIARVYSDWFHIDDSYLDYGENTITVTLNTNMHNVWTLPDGKPVQDSVKFFKKRQ